MDFVSNQESQIKSMLKEIGVTNFEELIADIPQELRVAPPQEIDGLSEMEGLHYMESLAKKNHFLEYDSFLGGGAYDHYVPAIVFAICSKSEFLTAYTPYQAEASQGILQATFEYQSAICALTGMDVANASVYDGGSAAAEAMLMALRHFRHKRRKLFLAGTLNPHYRKVVDQYLSSHEVELVTIPFDEEGKLALDQIEEAIDDSTAAVMIQSPNFFGVMEDVKTFSTLAKKVGALTILSANPLAYGLFASAKELGADIAVGDTQPFGLSMNFGGPYAGYMACKNNLIRQLPGRIVGETVDAKGERGFVLTLQAREQHIRREKATSNICTSQTLASFASLITILWYGKVGIKKLALTNYRRAAYLKSNLSKLPGVKVNKELTTFNEFVIHLSKPVEEVCQQFHKRKIVAGIPLKNYFPEQKKSLLVTVTEKKNKESLDNYLQVAREILI